jgi:hypothetical protein
MAVGATLVMEGRSYRRNDFFPAITHALLRIWIATMAGHGSG